MLTFTTSSLQAQVTMSCGRTFAKKDGDRFYCGISGRLKVSTYLEYRSLTWLAVALLSFGCLPETRKSGPIALTTSSASGFAPIWVNTDLLPISQPIAVGSAMVGIVTDDHKLFLVGIDPATGHELWRQQMTPGSVSPGIVVNATQVGDDKVAYFRPRPEDLYYAQLVVADARTGRDLATSPPARFTSYPYVCVSGKEEVCTISHGNYGGSEHQYRLELATGNNVTDSESLLPGSRLLAEPSLLDLADRPGNTLASLRDGKLQWRTPMSAAFPPGFSSDHGWNWHLFADQHVFVGSMYGEPLATGATYVRDLAEGSASAGLSEATGEVLWRDNGSSFQCNLGSKAYPVRCRLRGIATRRPATRTSFEGLDVTVEGFVPATGKTTWSVPIGAAETLASYDASLAIAGPTQIVLNRPTGPIVLDYATGSVTVPPPQATFWCMTTMRYEIFPSYWSEEGTLGYERSGGRLATICDDRGRPSTVMPSAEATMAAGAHVGAHAVIASRRGYVGFRIR